MHFTDYTAFIITVNNVAFWASSIFSFLVSLLLFALFFRRQKNKALVFLAIFFFILLVAFFAVKESFGKMPVYLEIVSS